MVSMHAPHQPSFRSYCKKNYDMSLLLVPGAGLCGDLQAPAAAGHLHRLRGLHASSNPIVAILKSDFVGWESFIRVFRWTEFLQALRNTFIISFMKIGCVFPLPILSALIIHSMRAMRFKKAVQTVIYPPHFFSWVVVSGISIGA